MCYGYYLHEEFDTVPWWLNQNLHSSPERPFITKNQSKKYIVNHKSCSERVTNRRASARRAAAWWHPYGNLLYAIFPRGVVTGVPSLVDSATRIFEVYSLPSFVISSFLLVSVVVEPISMLLLLLLGCSFCSLSSKTVKLVSQKSFW